MTASTIILRPHKPQPSTRLPGRRATRVSNYLSSGSRSEAAAVQVPCTRRGADTLVASRSFKRPAKRSRHTTGAGTHQQGMESGNGEPMHSARPHRQQFQGSLSGYYPERLKHDAWGRVREHEPCNLAGACVAQEVRSQRVHQKPCIRSICATSAKSGPGRPPTWPARHTGSTRRESWWPLQHAPRPAAWGRSRCRCIRLIRCPGRGRECGGLAQWRLRLQPAHRRSSEQ